MNEAAQVEPSIEPGPPWAVVANEPPRLPDPPLHRRVPPPAPLPSEPPDENSLPPAWSEDRERFKKIEEFVGLVGLTILVVAMIVAMWIRMTA